MIIYITENQPALEQSVGNRRLQTLIEEEIASPQTGDNIGLVIANVLRRAVQEEGHTFTLLSNGQRLVASEDQIRSKIGEYVQAHLAEQELQPARDNNEEEDADEEGDDDVDWLRGVRIDQFDEMILNDENLLMGDAEELIDLFPLDDEPLQEGNDDMVGEAFMLPEASLLDDEDLMPLLLRD